VAAQAIEVQLTAAQLTPQVALHPSQLARFGGDMEGIDHHLGRLIWMQCSQQLAPELLPHLTRQDLALQLGAQQRPGFTPEALDHMAEIDASQWPDLTCSPMQARQGFNELAAQEQIQPVMAQMHRELLTDQP